MLESIAKTLADPVAPQPVIASERFVLRPLQRSDAGLIAHYAGDERVARGTRSIPHPFPPGAAEALVARALGPTRSEDVWALDGTAQGLGELLGLIHLARMDRDQSEISFWIAPAFWNTGLASEAVGALIAANPQRSQTMFAEVFQDNPGSARVLTNNGFEYLGDAESFSVARGVVVPTWTYALPLKKPR
ncbi:50S ribosomal protein acetyltransferase [Rubellimicrobium mesophilum DSM 19309]|uniref:50S ribosomal protein acetyltransferase n=1 Tax=Rubellimicrobium mesophilum DSM 19309 TaxID=442562 RepID=A0A017HH19_9RHOB|nr:GNAT family N-acetyltransferase [Rubellimicrobium mesophilum]EYD73600.1 50S ribosomal protein acetyltransferase [Rubellimicrobium mesophilum DSM 19309]